MSRCEVLHSAPSLHVLSVVVFVIRARFVKNEIKKVFKKPCLDHYP